MHAYMHTEQANRILHALHAKSSCMYVYNIQVHVPHNILIVNCQKGRQGDQFITDYYLQTLYVTSLLRIGGALFLSACKRCSVTSGKMGDKTKVLNCFEINVKETCKSKLYM